MANIIIEKLSHSQKPVSSEARLILLGLTPGRQQHEIIEGSSSPRAGAFAGYMRKQMYQWFQELGIDDLFGIDDQDSIYTNPIFLKTVYISSLLYHPVYVEKNGAHRNYSGRNPKPWKHDSLFAMMKNTIEILSKVQHPVLLIPMGDTVSEGLRLYMKEKPNIHVLHGFPHPSGLNGHRHKKFELAKNEMLKCLSAFKRNMC